MIIFYTLLYLYAKRSLYGLKQAPCAWFDKFCSMLIRFSDSSLFLYKITKGIILLLVYVDDIIIIWTDLELIS